MNYKQVVFAREYRKMTQSDLADKVKGLNQPTLSKFEKGIQELDQGLQEAVAEVLNFPMEFFRNRVNRLDEELHYRKRTGILKSTKKYIEASISLLGKLVDELGHSIEWPEFRLKPLSIDDYSPTYVAQYTRKLLNLPLDAPVRNICTLLESAGIVIIEFESPTEFFDGVSFASEAGTPVIIINESFSNDRKRFTIAHELGHLLMHILDAPSLSNLRQEQKEEDANEFAAEFLMPEKAIKTSLTDLKRNYLIPLKEYWLCSMASIIFRARQLGQIDKDKAKYLYIELSRMGDGRKNELVDVFIDSPVLFHKAYELHKTELQFTKEEFSQAFQLPLDILEKLLFKSRITGKLSIVV